MNDTEKERGGWTGLLAALVVGRDLEQAQRRLRYGWMVGYVWAGWSFIGVMAGIWSLAPEAADRLDLRLFILAVLEVGLVAFLAYGVLRRRKAPATVLLGYFWISRVFWIAVGAIAVGSALEVVRFFVLQVAPAYLFLQAMRGAWTYHYLTHPGYPEGVVPRGEDLEDR